MRYRDLTERIDIGIPKTGKLWRWVETRKALSNMKSDSLYPGRWQHNIPGVGVVSGISFGNGPRRWDTGYPGVCFVVDRTKLDPAKIADIPGQEIFDYSTATIHPLGGGSEDLYLAAAMDENAEPTEAFYVGIIRPLSGVLVEILVKEKTGALYDAVAAYAALHRIPVKLVD